MNSLHWPVGDLDLGVGGVSYVELLILYELWAGERLFLEKAQVRYLRSARPISVSAVLFSPGIDIWRSCRFFWCSHEVSLLAARCGLGRFVPCFIGANHCRLRHIGWGKCGHGLTSRPSESASEPFLDELLFLFRYPVGSGRALLAGTLPFRYCFDRFACRTPSWLLLASGGVVDLVTANVADGHRVVPAVGRREVFLGSQFWFTKETNSTQQKKTLGHLAGFAVQSRPRVWKRLQPVEHSSVSIPDHKRRRSDQDHEGFIPAQARTGVG